MPPEDETKGENVFYLGSQLWPGHSNKSPWLSDSEREREGEAFMQIFNYISHLRLRQAKKVQTFNQMEAGKLKWTNIKMWREKIFTTFISSKCVSTSFAELIKSLIHLFFFFKFSSFNSQPRKRVRKVFPSSGSINGGSVPPLSSSFFFCSFF